MSVQLYSAPEEYYLDHISRCKEKFELLFPVFYTTIVRIFFATLDQATLRDSFLKMILFHDLGKLTYKWQVIVEKERRENRKIHKPSHSTLGAAYLWKILPAGFKDPISFAIAIHHTDRGLLGDNIEKPDVQAILDGITDNNGNINWHEEVKNLSDYYFTKEAHEINVISLKEMARGLRIWAKGCGLLEQHERRIQASLAHHILKLCDISAATERREYKKQGEQDYYGGWLMVENIKNYVDAISERAKQ
jgi:CRISPR-associated endonuclease Cas3-HD